MRSGLRVLILLFVLLLVLGLTIGERMWVRSWDHPLEVAVYPIVVDDASRAFVGQLSGDDFRDIGSYLSDEARARWQPVDRATARGSRGVNRRAAAGAAGRRAAGGDAVQPATALVCVPPYTMVIHMKFQKGLADTQYIILCKGMDSDAPILHEGTIGTVKITQQPDAGSRFVWCLADALDHCVGTAGQFVIDAEVVILATPDGEGGFVDVDLHTGDDIDLHENGHGYLLPWVADINISA